MRLYAFKRVLAFGLHSEKSLLCFRVVLEGLGAVLQSLVQLLQLVLLCFDNVHNL